MTRSSKGPWLVAALAFLNTWGGNPWEITGHLAQEAASF